MKIVQCPVCKTEREVEDDIILSICFICLNEMLEVKDGKKGNNPKGN